MGPRFVKIWDFDPFTLLETCFHSLYSCSTNPRHMHAVFSKKENEGSTISSFDHHTIVLLREWKLKHTMGTIIMNIGLSRAQRFLIHKKRGSHPLWPPTHVHKCEWVAVPYFRARIFYSVPHIIAVINAKEYK